ncbi:TraM recognition domain-containing protein [Dietzia sp. B19]|nr:TraM recognition domain-containing protein [Dietzia sp. B19]
MAGNDNPRNTRVSQFPPEHVVLLIMLAGFVAINVSVWAAHRAAVKLGGAEPPSPFPLLGAIEVLARDSVTWSPAATALLVTQWLVVVVITAGIILARRRWRLRRTGGTQSRIAHATRQMASTSDIATLSPRARKREHRDNNLPDCGWYGSYLGREWSTGQVLMSGTEDNVLNLWAPREGKTTSKAIPEIWNAPGLVVATSCKRDLIDETIQLREHVGEVWVFDPQNLAPGAGEGRGFFFDPLDFVRAARYWDGSALRLAEIFEGATTARSAVSGDAGENAFFYQQARDLLTALFLAAALGNKPITDVYRWVSAPGAGEPLTLLAGSTYEAQHDDLNAKYSLTPRTRDGVFSAAKNCIACLGLAEVREWLTPHGHRRRLDVTALAHDDRATLYMLTEEDNPVARPISTVLAILVSEALKKRASQFERDRLPVPVLMVLDEIANVVRWPNLPEALSTYGSRGILFDIFLQTYAQGEEMWGPVGMRKLYALVAIKVIGPGQTEPEFAQMVSTQVGTYREVERSVSYSNGSGSSSQQVGGDKPILSVDEIQNLQKWQMIVIAKGRRPMLARMIPATQQDFSPATRELLDRLERGQTGVTVD